MFDLDAYLTRIGLADAGAPALGLLRRIVAGHTATIPFENLDIVLGRPILLDTDAIQAKLVRQRRGGYCFEQNTLLRAALDALGFQVTTTLARVMRGVPDGVVNPLTHLVLLVDLPEGRFLADVGWGNLTPTAPLAMDEAGAQPSCHEDFRLARVDGETRLQVRLGGEWSNIYRTNLLASYPVDHELGNWFTSTRPGGPFTTNAIVARPAEFCRKTMFNGALTIRDMHNRSERRTLDSPNALRGALIEHFGLELTAAESATVHDAIQVYAPASKFRFD